MANLVWNEQNKLLAMALNGAAVSAFAVGVLAPIAALVYNLPGRPPSVLGLAGGMVLWTAAAVALHMGGRLTLRVLRE